MLSPRPPSASAAPGGLALPNPGPLRLGLILLPALLLLAPLAACGDLDTAPAVEMRGEDPVVSLHFSDRLPTLPALAERWAPELGLAPLNEAWRSSWEEDPDEGPALRRAAIEAAVPILVEFVPATARAQAYRQVHDALRGAEEVLGVSLDGVNPGFSGTPDPASEVERGEGEGGSGFEGTLVQASRELERARVQGEAGNDAAELRHILLASDLLRGTTADALARGFVQQAEGLLRRFLDAPSYSVVTVERAERLLAGAREALDVGQPALALQRAWYAVGLLRAAESLNAPSPDQDFLEPGESTRSS